MPLSDYSDDELRAELARRERSRRPRKPKKFCDDCAHYVVWSQGYSSPDDYNPCSLGHQMDFICPDSYTDEEWGFFRPRCKDRIENRSSLDGEAT